MTLFISRSWTNDSLLWFQVLHIVGSPTDEFSFCLNLFYASSFDVKAHPQFQHKWAIVRPEDKKWTFTQDLTNVVQTDTGKLIKNSDVEWFNLPNAMAVISTEIRPVLVVPHLFCLDGSTKCRYVKIFWFYKKILLFQPITKEEQFLVIHFLDLDCAQCPRTNLNILIFKTHFT